MAAAAGALAVRARDAGERRRLLAGERYGSGPRAHGSRRTDLDRFLPDGHLIPQGIENVGEFFHRDMLPLVEHTREIAFVKPNGLAEGVSGRELLLDKAL